ncbi:MAG: kinase/pyrophosphorylase, partial [Pseudomonadota bacterium]
MIKKRTVIYVSDGTGITSETLGQGLLAQFEGIEFRHLRFPFLDSADKVGDCVSRINEVGRSEGVRPIVIMTLTNTDYSAQLHKADALFIDLCDAFVVPLE